MQTNGDVRFYVLTVSDRCSKGENTDLSGPSLCSAIRDEFLCMDISYGVVADEKWQIIDTLDKWIESGLACASQVIFTVGGTGLSARDVTPEATRAVIVREVPGITHAIINHSLRSTEMAMLSRATCGTKNNTLIINFPGSTKAVLECFEVVKPILPHAMALLSGNIKQTDQDHFFMRELYHNPSKVNVGSVAARDRKSKFRLVELSEAILMIHNTKFVVEFIPQIEDVHIASSLGRVLAQDIYSKNAVPPFDASIKDGYAVFIDDSKPMPVRRRVVGACAAGDKSWDSKCLDTSTAVRISTGAPIPDGANAVIQVEDTELIETTASSTEERVIELLITPTIGQDIRKMGADVPLNTQILNKGARIDGPMIGLLASIGVEKVPVCKRQSIGIISTGNELVWHSDPVALGQIRDSNKLTIINLLKTYGYDMGNITDCGIARDTPNEVKAAFQRALSKCDIVISTGGVSMGEFDLVKSVLVEDFDATIHFGRINMKPGKPTTVATLVYQRKEKIIFSLPGNPVSASVTCLLFVIPLLKRLEGIVKYNFPQVKIKVNQTVTNTDTRPEFVRAIVSSDGTGQLEAITTGNQMSSRLNSMVGCNGLMYLPPNSTIESQDTTDVFLIAPINCQIIDAN